MLYPSLAHAAVILTGAFIALLTNGASPVFANPSGLTTLPPGSPRGNSFRSSTTVQISTQGFQGTKTFSAGISTPLSSSTGPNIPATKPTGSRTPRIITEGSDPITASDRGRDVRSQGHVHSPVISSGPNEVVPRTVQPSSTSKLPLTTTKHAISEAQLISQASLLPSKLSELDAAIAAWKSDPCNLGPDTLDQIDRIKNDIQTLMSGAGGSSSSGLGSEKRSLNGGIIYDATPTLSYIVEDLSALHDAVEDEVMSDADDLIDTLSVLSSDLEQKLDGSSSSSSSSFPRVCALGSCGDRCERPPQPLSDASMVAVMTGQACIPAEEVTLNSPPTATLGAYGTLSVFSGFPLASGRPVLPGRPDTSNETLAARSLDTPQSLPHRLSYYSGLIAAMQNGWVSQAGPASGVFYSLPIAGGNPWTVAGVNGLYGCTAVIIASAKGAYLAHIWEDPVFVNIKKGEPTPLETFQQQSYETLLLGDQFAASIHNLMGTDLYPGPLHGIYTPRVFVFTPFANSSNTLLQYDERAQQIGFQLSWALASGGWEVFGYSRQGYNLSTSQNSYFGKVIIEFDQVQRLVTWAGDWDKPNGMWRIWVEGNIVAQQSYWSDYVVGCEMMICEYSYSR